MDAFSYRNSHIEISADQNRFLSISTNNGAVNLECPAFEINGECLSDFRYAGCEKLSGRTQLYYKSESNPALCLAVELVSNINTPFVRFRYRLGYNDDGCEDNSGVKLTLTKKNGKDNIRYFSIQNDDGNWDKICEYQFAQFIPHIHSFVPHENFIDCYKLHHGATLTGPSLKIYRGNVAFVVAYEHGAECPNHYLHFSLNSTDLEVCASKGNYYNGFKLTKSSSFVSCWFHIGVMDNEAGKEEVSDKYREFFLKYMGCASESRKPYLFYNTWNYQERDHCFKHTPYLERMNLEKVLREIDAAHEIGIEYFVLDTGWYGKTGDWLVNTKRFPDGLAEIRKRLDSYGMKLGLWFNPTVAAKTSAFVTEHPEYIMTQNGKAEAEPIWETEESYGMCMCSDYAALFAKKLIELYNTIGVRYFKWDGISQFGCDSPIHNHGTEENSPEERAECYSYQMGLAMIDIAQTLLDECPDAIVDFDITEAGRFVGLGFLSVGKYFLVNNGPYAKDLDIPENFHHDMSNTYINPYTNIFFYPGVARPRFCRTGIRYDDTVPSILFLTHYLPDGNEIAQSNSVASLVLGGNGIWGDLEALSDDERNYLKNQLELYKRVRDEATKVPVSAVGITGSSPEIYEKINTESATGLVSIFTCQAGEYEYITNKLDKAPKNIVGADSFEILSDGSVRIKVKLDKDMARVIYFFD